MARQERKMNGTERLIIELVVNSLLNGILVIVALIACALCLFSGLYVSGLLLLCILLLKLFFAISLAETLSPVIKLATEILKMFNGSGEYTEARVFALLNNNLK